MVGVSCLNLIKRIKRNNVVKHFRISKTVMIICFSRCYVFNYCRVEQNTSKETHARNKPEVIRINDFSANFIRCRLLYVPLFRQICNNFSYRLKKRNIKINKCSELTIASYQMSIIWNNGKNHRWQLLIRN